MFETVGAILLLATSVCALPLASVHVKFVSPPNVYEHGITTDGDRTIAQKSYISIGRRSSDFEEFGRRLAQIRMPVRKYVPSPIPVPNEEGLWPNGVYAPPPAHLIYSPQKPDNHVTPDFSNGLDYPDPLLLTGNRAKMAVRYLYGRGELYHSDIPHVRALLRNQEERVQNGLAGHVLGSLRPTSPFYRNN